MPLSYKQLGNTFIQGQNIIIYPSGNSYVISKPDTESFGFTSVGIAGFDFFPPGAIYVYPIDILQDLTGPNATMIYKSFSAGTGIGIINSNNTLIFTATTPTINGLTSFTSAGTGNRLLLSTAITSNTLFYKSITGTSNLDVNDNNGTLTFSLAGGGSGTIISGTNVGTGINVFTGLSTTTNPNDTLAFRNILAGDNISIALSVSNDGDIVISRGVNVVNQISPTPTGTTPVGFGARVLSSITATNLLPARTIPATNNGITSSNPASILLLRPTNATANRLFTNDSTNVLVANTYAVDATIGAIGIGQISISGTKLIFGPHAANYSVFRLNASTTYIGATDGDIWYDTSNNLKFNKGAGLTTDFLFKDNNSSLTGASNTILIANTAGTLSIKYVNSFGIFNSLSSVTIENTSTETSVISSVLTGTTTLFASNNTYNPELGVGRKYRFNAKGIIQTDNSSVDNLTVNIKLSSTTIATSSAFLVNKGTAANTYFEIDATFTIRNSGLVICSGKVIGGSNITRTPAKIINGIYSQNATITTTSNQIFDCTVKFDQANANNTIIIHESTLEILN
jgi:hypothetical protein